MNGYLGIDVELGGPDFISGQDAILEIALLDVPDPLKSNCTIEEFLSIYVTKSRVRHFVITPYANVNNDILKNILKKDISYYNNGDSLTNVASNIKKYITEIGNTYQRITPVSDWHGDIIALDFILSKIGTSIQKMTKQHNMLHIKSLVCGIDNPDISFAESKKRLGVKNILRRDMHSSDMDCMNTVETFVRAAYLKKSRNEHTLRQMKNH